MKLTSEEQLEKHRLLAEDIAAFYAKRDREMLDELRLKSQRRAEGRCERCGKLPPRGWWDIFNCAGTCGGY